MNTALKEQRDPAEEDLKTVPHSFGILLYVAEKGYIKIIKDYSTNNVSDWNDTMNCAAEGGFIDIVYLMIERGANDWNTSLIYAAEKGHIDIVELMIEKGATNFCEGIEYAAKGKYMNIVSLLLEEYFFREPCEREMSIVINLNDYR